MENIFVAGRDSQAGLGNAEGFESEEKLMDETNRQFRMDTAESLARINDAMVTITQHILREETRWEKLEIIINGDPTTGVLGMNVRIDRLESGHAQRTARERRFWVVLWSAFVAATTAFISKCHAVLLHIVGR